MESRCVSSRCGDGGWSRRSEVVGSSWTGFHCRRPNVQTNAPMPRVPTRSTHSPSPTSLVQQGHPLLGSAAVQCRSTAQGVDVNGQKLLLDERREPMPPLARAELLLLEVLVKRRSLRPKPGQVVRDARKVCGQMDRAHAFRQPSQSQVCSSNWSSSGRRGRRCHVCPAAWASTNDSVRSCMAALPCSGRPVATHSSRPLQPRPCARTHWVERCAGCMDVPASYLDASPLCAVANRQASRNLGSSGSPLL
jgi:hypothetical protein